MKIFSTDIADKKSFSFADDTLVQKECLDRDKHIYLYERIHDGKVLGYELVQGVRRKNPDGKVVHIYPSTEQFGTYGFFIARAFADKDVPALLKRMQEKKDRTKPQDDA